MLGQFEDQQTGLYIARAFHDMKHKGHGVDTRALVKHYGFEQAQIEVFNEIDDLKLDVEIDVVLVLKGLELAEETLDKLRLRFKNSIFVNWFFDVYLEEKPIWENKDKYDFINKFDFFVCSLKGVADKLKEKGFSNIYYVDQACHPLYNGEVSMNNYQKRLYGEDISFVGNLGYIAHSNRIKTLNRIIDEGFNIKIWGDIVVDPKYIGPKIFDKHSGRTVYNEDHSKVCASSLINLGVDQDESVDMGWSARLYKVLCAGGLYLTNATKGLDKMFNVNKKGEPITDDQDLVVFYDEEDLTKKLDFLLEHEDIRESIRKNGQKKVLEYHTYEHRLNELLDLITGE